ncbi:putative amidoligase enzyme-domain-containing protein [Xylariomycetidae sp. FL2044]|nr:putative amidoligase enzyme-domain-containing protein [Xylariomycetidae sp. FL2044]
MPFDAYVGIDIGPKTLLEGYCFLGCQNRANLDSKGTTQIIVSDQGRLGRILEQGNAKRRQDFLVTESTASLSSAVQIGMNKDYEELTVPVATRLSYGIELEFVVASVPTSAADPHEAAAGSLPPLLRIDEQDEDMVAVAVCEHIRATLRVNDIDVGDPVASFAHLASAQEAGVPRRLHGKDKWEVATDSTVERTEPDGYQWSGIEVRSPASWNREESYELVWYVINLLKKQYRIRVNPTCGFHVHVGHGDDNFSAATMKRLGAFLWAADPVLSRLHAPYRRVAAHSRSIRLESNLALGQATASDAVAAVAEWAREKEEDGDGILDPIPEAEWSDTTREELEYGGREGWEEYARWRREVGPTVKVPVSPSSDSDDAESWEGWEEDETEVEGEEDEDEDDEDGDDGPVPHNQDYHRRRALHARLTSPEIVQLCTLVYGHRFPLNLQGPQQMNLITMVECERLFGHCAEAPLSAAEDQQLFEAVAPYAEAATSAWTWSPTEQRTAFSGAQAGFHLAHPKPRRRAALEAVGSAPRLVARWEELASLTEVDGIDGIQFLSRDEWHAAGRTNRGMAEMLEDLMDYVDDEPEKGPSVRAEEDEGAFVSYYCHDNDDDKDCWISPSPPASAHSISGASLAGVVATDGFDPRTAWKTAHPPSPLAKMGPSYPNAATTTTTTTTMQNENSELQIAESAALGAQRAYPTPPPSCTWTQASSPFARLEGETSPALLGAHLRGGAGSPGFSPSDRLGIVEGLEAPSSSYRTASASPEFTTPSPAFSTPPPLLRPLTPAPRWERVALGRQHDLASLPDDYVAHVSATLGLSEADWARIPFPPPPLLLSFSPRSSLSCPPTPEGSCAPSASVSAVDSTTTMPMPTTREGIEQIMACASAAEVAHLLCGPRRRLNYNLHNYAPQTLALLAEDARPRTVEFREGAGTLDAELVEVWARVCAGIVAWCERARGADFLRVLEKVVVMVDDGQREEGEEGGEEGFEDVCDLLEELGLHLEAEIVRWRESLGGPPR